MTTNTWVSIYLAIISLCNFAPIMLEIMLGPMTFALAGATPPSAEFLFVL